MLRMITRSKHIVLDTDYYGSKLVVKVKIINGFSANNLKQNVCVEENHWVPDPANDVLYFMSGCSIPRFKLKDRFKITNKLTKANTLFISDSVINDNPYIKLHRKMYNIYDYCVNYSYDNFSEKLGKLNEFYEDLISAHKDTDLEHYYKNQYVLFTSLMHNQSTFYVTEHLLAIAYNINLGTASNRIEFYDVVNPWSIKHYAKEKLAIANQLLEVSKDSDLLNFTGNVYLQYEMLKHVKGDDFIMDFAKYKEFVTMGKAGEENLILCMELMANCNFEKSFIYLLFLLYEFYPEINYLKEKDHVNFKSLVNFVYLCEPKRLNLDTNAGIEIMKKHKKHTASNLAMWNELCYTNNIKEEIVI